MTKKRRQFQRASNTRDYRPVFIIATEGEKTEPDYLRMKIFKPPTVTVHIEPLPTKKSSSPSSVLKRMEKHLRDYRIREGDEAWLIVDKDLWKDEQLELLHVWSTAHPYKGLAVSNPQFEYWLLLHFEEGNNVHNKNECLSRLRCHLPNYDKGNLPVNKFTLSRVRDAIRRAKLKDNPPCEKWPETIGTTVYRMIERIIL